MYELERFLLKVEFDFCDISLVFYDVFFWRWSIRRCCSMGFSSYHFNLYFIVLASIYLRRKDSLVYIYIYLFYVLWNLGEEGSFLIHFFISKVKTRARHPDLACTKKHKSIRMSPNFTEQVEQAEHALKSMAYGVLACSNSKKVRTKLSAFLTTVRKLISHAALCDADTVG